MGKFGWGTTIESGIHYQVLTKKYSKNVSIQCVQYFNRDFGEKSNVGIMFSNVIYLSIYMAEET